MDAQPPLPSPALLLASGTQPDWRLFRRGDTLWLVERGRPALRAIGVRRARDPFRSQLAAPLTNGSFLVLTWRFGACRPAEGLPAGGYTATVSFEGRTLSGCYSGRPPGERPILD